MFKTAMWVIFVAVWHDRLFHIYSLSAEQLGVDMRARVVIRQMSGNPKNKFWGTICLHGLSNANNLVDIYANAAN